MGFGAGGEQPGEGVPLLTLSPLPAHVPSGGPRAPEPLGSPGVQTSRKSPLQDCRAASVTAD